MSLNRFIASGLLAVSPLLHGCDTTELPDRPMNPPSGAADGGSDKPDASPGAPDAGFPGNSDGQKLQTFLSKFQAQCERIRRDGEDTSDVTFREYTVTLPDGSTEKCSCVQPAIGLNPRPDKVRCDSAKDYADGTSDFTHMEANFVDFGEGVDYGCVEKLHSDGTSTELVDGATELCNANGCRTHQGDMSGSACPIDWGDTSGFSGVEWTPNEDVSLGRRLIRAVLELGQRFQRRRES